ncbi:MAG: phosphotransferase, partial [candidate division Zixibacteria bacterium]|nr:phosphotransferase [candidate division Zixibacteria bacterium]
DDVTTQHCLQIGELFGQMHECRLSIEKFALPASQAFDKDHWTGLIERSQSTGCEWVDEARAALSELVRFSAAYSEALPLLQSDMVASHRDMDIKNVMWDPDGNAVIIDWEAAGPVHPMWELLDAAFNWCGQSSGQPNKELFKALIAGYRTVQPLDTAMIEPVFAGCLGARMEWLEFNMQRSINADTPPDEKAMGTEQVTSTLADIMSLAARRIEFVEWLRSSA